MKLSSRILAALMAVLLAAGMPLAALADTYDLANGSISINANENGQTVTQAENNIYDNPDDSPVITQSESETSNTVTITAEENATANVTLKDVNIDVSDTGSVSSGGKITCLGEAAVEITGKGDVIIELDGNNTVESGAGRAGVEKDNGGNLTITDDNTPGSLTATGGEFGAGIGGGYRGEGSNITIDASGFFTIPCWVIDVVVEQGVTLAIHWTGGEDIVIDHQPDTGSQKIWVFTFTTLPQLLAK